MSDIESKSRKLAKLFTEKEMRDDKALKEMINKFESIKNQICNYFELKNQNVSYTDLTKEGESYSTSLTIKIPYTNHKNINQKKYKELVFQIKIIGNKIVYDENEFIIPEQNNQLFDVFYKSFEKLAE